MADRERPGLPTAQQDHATEGTWLGGAAMALAAVMAMAPAWSDIIRVGRTDGEASHVLLAPFVIAYLAWSRRGAARGLTVRGRMLGPCLVAIGWLSSELGVAHSHQALWHSGAVLVLIGAVIAVTGAQIVTRFAAAVGAFAFIVPVPAMLRVRLTLPLQAAVAEAVCQVCRPFSDDVERLGNVVYLNGVGVAIAEACAGVRMIFGLALVAYVLAFTSCSSIRTRILVLLLSPLVAMACNVLRLSATVWLYGRGDAGWARWFHDSSGWAVIPLGLLLVFSLATCFARTRGATSTGFAA